MKLRELLFAYNGRYFRICSLKDQKWIVYDVGSNEELKQKIRKEIEPYKDCKVYEFTPHPLNDFEGFIEITI